MYKDVHLFSNSVFYFTKLKNNNNVTKTDREIQSASRFFKCTIFFFQFQQCRL